MRSYVKQMLTALGGMLFMLAIANAGHAQLMFGQKAPVFALNSLDGIQYDLSQMKTRPMVILYFFDATSNSSQQGLISLDHLAKMHAAANLEVWGITRSAAQTVRDFVARAGIGFPILPDTSDVSDRYFARLVLPTACILGPDLKVLDFMQGGGKSTEIMMAKLAERNLERKQYALAKALSEEVVKKDPQNLEAQMVKGYADLKQGNLDQARTTFDDLAGKGGQAEVVGKEGLATVYAQTGQQDKALALAADVEKRAPDRVYPHVIQGNVLYAQNKKKEAEAQYQKAVQKKSAAAFQKAEGLNKLGRLQASVGNYKTARDLYDQAVAIDPYYIEATSNKGVTYEKEGRWDQALGAYQQALAVDKTDTFAAVLARQAQERLALQNDAARKKRLDTLVKDLAERFRSQKAAGVKVEDEWTSRPMILTFVDFQETGGLGARDGFADVLTAQLTEQLNSSGRVQVVERVLVERLLEELNLGTSDLANPETKLRLGQVLAAKLIGTGSLVTLPAATLVNLRLIDTETSAIAKVFTQDIQTSALLQQEFLRLNRDILKTIIQKYPLQGYVVQVSDDQVMLNLGSGQGVVLGTAFDVLKEQEPIEYKGKKLRSAPKTIAQLKVTRVEPDLCYASISTKGADIRKDDKVKEQLESTGN
jgi:tetratricopeptide (TPR) repeat protein